jgi:hypothetical protein
MPKDVRIFAPPKNFFSPWRKITQILKSRITHMVTSNGGHPLHYHLRHSGRLSNSLFNRRPTKQTFTQWPQASTLWLTPQWPSRPLISTPTDRVQSYLSLYVLGLSRSRTCISQKNIVHARVSSKGGSFLYWA